MRRKILDCPIDDLSRNDILDVVRNSVKDDTKALQLVALNVAKLVKARKSPSLYKTLEDAEVVYVDGAGISVASKLMGYLSVLRVSV